MTQLRVRKEVSSLELITQLLKRENYSLLSSTDVIDTYNKTKRKHDRAISLLDEQMFWLCSCCKCVFAQVVWKSVELKFYFAKKTFCSNSLSSWHIGHYAWHNVGHYARQYAHRHNNYYAWAKYIMPGIINLGIMPMQVWGLKRYNQKQVSQQLTH